MRVKAFDNTINRSLNISINSNKIHKIVGVDTIISRGTITDIERDVFKEKSVFDYVYKVYYGRNYYTISLNSYQNFIFLWGLRKNWLQKEENIRYAVNLLFLIIGSYLTYKQIK